MTPSSFCSRLAFLGYDWVYLPVFPYIGVVLPCDFTSLMGPKTVTDFQFVQVFFFLPPLQEWE